MFCPLDYGTEMLAHAGFVYKVKIELSSAHEKDPGQMTGVFKIIKQ